MTLRKLNAIGLFALLTCSSTAWPEDRSYDGSGNNLDNPTWGAVGIQYNRLASAAYGDGISTPAGEGNPGPREISNAVGAQIGSVPNQRNLSGFVYAFGQFLNHDVELTRTGGAGSLPIRTPPDDRFFQGRTLPFSRSRFDRDTGTNADNPREQINWNTSYVDASNVYGYDQGRADRLRETTNGELSAKLETGRNKSLPRNSAIPIEMDNGGFQVASNMFSAGDIRANENVALASLHTLFLREHNRLVDELSAAHPTWTNELLYQRARKIVGAQLQVVTFHEFLPALLGPHAPSPHGTYDPSIDPTTINEFATLFLRVGHSMLAPGFRRIQNDSAPAGRDPVRLGTTEFAITPLLNSADDLDFHLKGLAVEPQAEVDTLVDNGLRNVVAANIDLYSIDIQRARDHGLADYNTMRAGYGLPVANSFTEITSDENLQVTLQDLYGDVNSIDPIVGMLAEDHLADAGVGALVAAGFNEQFTRLRDGDRFWYENDAEFTSEEIEQLQATRLSDIIRRNTSLTSLQGNVFFVPELQAGDANQDFVFNQLDLVKVQIASKYLTERAATWGEGDWNGAPGGGPTAPPSGDGLFNQLDIVAAQRVANYLAGAYAAIQLNGRRADGQTSIVYDAATGALAVDAPTTTELTSINIDSAVGIFSGSAAQNLGGSFDNDADNNIFKATFGSNFGSLSFGNVAQPGLSEEFVLGDLAVIGSLAGGGDLGDVDLIYVPEPRAVVLAFLGVVSILISNSLGDAQFAFRLGRERRVQPKAASDPRASSKAPDGSGT